MTAIMAENKLNSYYWGRSSNRMTLDTYIGAQVENHSILNAFDGSSHTSFKSDSGSTRSVINFPEDTYVNGLAIHGHNMRPDQGLYAFYGLVPESSPNDNFFEAPYGNTAIIKPTDNLYHPIGAMLDTGITIRCIQFLTLNWDADTYISNISLGAFVTTGINISAPFVPPSYRTYKNEIKQNNLGQPISAGIRPVPQRLKINLNQMDFEDLNSIGVSDQMLTTINGQKKTFPMVEYFGHFMQRHPFTLMYDTGLASDSDAEKIIKRNKLYHCIMDGELRQPSYTTPTTLSWSISAKAYL